MHRLDPTLRSLDGEVAAATNDDAKAAAAARVKEREDALAPLYMQVAHEFADLHDRAGRMKAKGVVRDVLAWPRAREYLYWRTRRRLAEDELRAKFTAVDGALPRADVTAQIEALAGAAACGDDRAFLAWAEGAASAAAVGAALDALKTQGVATAVQALLASLPAAEAAAVRAAL